MEENRVPKRVLYMNLETTRLRGRLMNRWQVEVREDGRLVSGEGWQERVCNREECEKLLRTARNRYILSVNECMNHPTYAEKGFPLADDYLMHIRVMLINLFIKHVLDDLFILINIIL
jgi:hypothetical protein